MESIGDQYEADVQLKDFYIAHRVEESVSCITFQDLLRRHNIKSVDFLQIDTEGYELEILSTIDFRRFPIRLVNYKSVLLHENKEKAEQPMRDSGYTLIDHGQDTFCYRADNEGLTKLFKVLLRASG
jgi:hypothetical protein